eukprot:TRINITY_DN428_c0_g1_i1.p1 TRINITY_DN428_c0_g1~~TRINITY_DN428_c0_g1_i1.p1  ORF type:complete len:2193 (+),score=413.85 TRINITY_DN428_c0_g1_i1:261-6839(+)
MDVISIAMELEQAAAPAEAPALSATPSSPDATGTDGVTVTTVESSLPLPLSPVIISEQNPGIDLPSPQQRHSLTTRSSTSSISSPGVFLSVQCRPTSTSSPEVISASMASSTPCSVSDITSTSLILPSLIRRTSSADAEEERSDPLGDSESQVSPHVNQQRNQWQSSNSRVVPTTGAPAYLHRLVGGLSSCPDSQEEAGRRRSHSFSGFSVVAFGSHRTMAEKRSYEPGELASSLSLHGRDTSSSTCSHKMRSSTGESSTTTTEDSESDGDYDFVEEERPSSRITMSDALASQQQKLQEEAALRNNKQRKQRFLTFLSDKRTGSLSQLPTKWSRKRTSKKGISTSQDAVGFDTPFIVDEMEETEPTTMAAMTARMIPYVDVDEDYEGRQAPHGATFTSTSTTRYSLDPRQPGKGSGMSSSCRASAPAASSMKMCTTSTPGDVMRVRIDAVSRNAIHGLGDDAGRTDTAPVFVRKAGHKHPSTSAPRDTEAQERARSPTLHGTSSPPISPRGTPSMTRKFIPGSKSGRFSPPWVSPVPSPNASPASSPPPPSSGGTFPGVVMRDVSESAGNSPAAFPGVPLYHVHKVKGGATSARCAEKGNKTGDDCVVARYNRSPTSGRLRAWARAVQQTRPETRSLREMVEDLLRLEKSYLSRLFAVRRYHRCIIQEDLVSKFPNGKATVRLIFGRTEALVRLHTALVASIESRLSKPTDSQIKLGVNVFVRHLETMSTAYLDVGRHTKVAIEAYETAKDMSQSLKTFAKKMEKGETCEVSDFVILLQSPLHHLHDVLNQLNFICGWSQALGRGDVGDSAVDDYSDDGGAGAGDADDDTNSGGNADGENGDGDNGDGENADGDADADVDPDADVGFDVNANANDDANDGDDDDVDGNDDRDDDNEQTVVQVEKRRSALAGIREDHDGLMMARAHIQELIEKIEDANELAERKAKFKDTFTHLLGMPSDVASLLVADENNCIVMKGNLVVGKDTVGIPHDLFNNRVGCILFNNLFMLTHQVRATTTQGKRNYQYVGHIPIWKLNLHVSEYQTSSPLRFRVSDGSKISLVFHFNSKEIMEWYLAIRSVVNEYRVNRQFFGAMLSTVMFRETEKENVTPSFLVKCYNFIKERHLDTVDLFRTMEDDDSERRHYMKDRLNNGEDLRLKDDESPRVVAALIKDWYRLLPSPLFTDELYHDFVTAVSPREKGRGSALGALNPLSTPPPASRLASTSPPCSPPSSPPRSSRLASSSPPCSPHGQQTSQARQPTPPGTARSPLSSSAELMSPSSTVPSPPTVQYPSPSSPTRIDLSPIHSSVPSPLVEPSPLLCTVEAANSTVSPLRSSASDATFDEASSTTAPSPLRSSVPASPMTRKADENVGESDIVPSADANNDVGGNDDDGDGAKCGGGGDKDGDDSSALIEKLRALLARLPSGNRALLQELFLFLRQVADHGDKNNVTPQSLALAFANTLLWCTTRNDADYSDGATEVSDSLVAPPKNKDGDYAAARSSFESHGRSNSHGGSASRDTVRARRRGHMRTKSAGSMMDRSVRAKSSWLQVQPDGGSEGSLASAKMRRARSSDGSSGSMMIDSVTHQPTSPQHSPPSSSVKFPLAYSSDPRKAIKRKGVRGDRESDGGGAGGRTEVAPQRDSDGIQFTLDLEQPQPRRLAIDVAAISGSYADQDSDDCGDEQTMRASPVPSPGIVDSTSSPLPSPSSSRPHSPPLSTSSSTNSSPVTNPSPPRLSHLSPPLSPSSTSSLRLTSDSSPRSDASGSPRSPSTSPRGRNPTPPSSSSSRPKSPSSRLRSLSPPRREPSVPLTGSLSPSTARFRQISPRPSLGSRSLRMSTSPPADSRTSSPSVLLRQSRTSIPNMRNCVTTLPHPTTTPSPRSPPKSPPINIPTSPSLSPRTLSSFPSPYISSLSSTPSSKTSSSSSPSTPHTATSTSTSTSISSASTSLSSASSSPPTPSSERTSFSSILSATSPRSTPSSPFTARSVKASSANIGLMRDIFAVRPPKRKLSSLFAGGDVGMVAFLIEHYQELFHDAERETSRRKVTAKMQEAIHVRDQRMHERRVQQMLRQASLVQLFRPVPGAPRGLAGEAALSISRPLRQGYLSQKKKKRRKWKARWFVLKFRVLLYYNYSQLGAPKSELPRGKIHLSEAVHVDFETKTSRPFGFTVETDQRVFHLAARCNEDRKAWMQAIASAC